MAFINYTNHPSSRWSEKMLSAAQAYGEISDVPFKAVAPRLSRDEVMCLAQSEAASLMRVFPDASKTVIMLQGEMTLAFHMVRILKEYGYTCLASTSERVSVEKENGVRESIFEFVRFREY